MIERRAGGTPVAFSTAEPGDRIGGYKIEALLGVGGTASVYHATTRDGHPVALKLIRDDRLHDADARKRFLREARVGALLHHPNIVRFVDFGDDKGLLFLVMELIRGVTLWTHVETPAPAEDVRTIFLQIFDALAHAHARGVVHRDLKPDNILIPRDEEGRPSIRLVDFGVVQLQTEMPTTATQSVIGTPEYMSPEQCLGSPTVSSASDLYAVGVMLWEVLTGSLPFIGGNTATTLLAHLRDELPPFRLRDAYEADPALEHVLRRLLAREPADRYPNAAAARKAFAATNLWNRQAHHRSLETPPRAPQPRVEPPPAAVGLFLVSDPPFVDLRGELQELQLHLQRHIEARGPGYFLSLSGDAGSGRTRFIQELAARLHEAGLAHVWYADTAANDTPLDTLHALLHAGYPAPMMHPDDGELRLEAQLRNDGFTRPAELEEALKLLQTSPRGKNTEYRRHLATRIIHAAAQRHPVILIVDNLDHNDGELLDELPRLLTLPPDATLIVIASWRTESELHRSGFEDRLHTFRSVAARWTSEHRTLPRLGLRDMQRFLRRTIAIGANAATLVADRADGNPSFAIELLRVLVTHHGEAILDDPVSLNRALTSLPTKVSHLLTERVHTLWTSGLLDASILEAIEMMSFLGIHFPTSQAYALLDENPTDSPQILLARVLSTPALSSLISEKDGEIRFHDRLTRAAFMHYAEASGRAERWHQRCADIKIADRPDDAPQTIAEIADHCIAAGLFVRARALYLNAAETQSSAHLWIEALHSIDGAIRTYERDTDPDILELAELLIQRTDLLVALSRYTDAHNTLRTLDRLHSGDELDDYPKLLRLRAIVDAQVHRDVHAARLQFQNAIYYADSKGQVDEAIVARLQFSDLLHHVGHFHESEQTLRRGLELTPQSKRPELHAFLLAALGQNALHIGAIDEARSFAHTVTTFFQRNAHRRGLAVAYMLQGQIHRAAGEHTAAWDPLRQAQEEFLVSGDRLRAALAACELGAVADALGQVSRARICFEQALATFQRFHERTMSATCRLHLAALDAVEGRWRSAGEQILAAITDEPDVDSHTLAWNEAMMRVAREAILSDRAPLARDLLLRTLRRTARLPDQNVPVRQLDEVVHLLYQLNVN